MKLGFAAWFIPIIVLCVVYWLTSDELQSNISPTAHYTGYVWYRNGMSDTRLFSIQGLLFYYLFQPIAIFSRARGGNSTEQYLLARHTTIDARLKEAIDIHNVTYVIEIAAGLSPRGIKFVNLYPDGAITYIETDLPDMASKKLRLLALDTNTFEAAIGTSASDAGTPEARGQKKQHHHFVMPLNMLLASGPESLHSIISNIPTDVRVAVVMEGLLGYYDTATVVQLWTRISTLLLQRTPQEQVQEPGRFQPRLAPRKNDVYLSDLRFAFDDSIMRWVLSKFVKGKVYLHFQSHAEAIRTLTLQMFQKQSRHRTAVATDTGTAAVENVSSDLDLQQQQIVAVSGFKTATVVDTGVSAVQIIECWT